MATTVKPSEIGKAKRFLAKRKIKTECVGPLIGKGGWRIQQFKSDSNAWITISKDVDANGEVECIISSNDILNTNKAMDLVNGFLNEFETKEKEQGKEHVLTTTVSMSGMEVTMKAVLSKGEYRCVKCDTSFGISKIQSQLKSHAKKCLKIQRSRPAQKESLAEKQNLSDDESESDWICYEESS